MSELANHLVWLQSLYDSFTNDDWEHQFGCKIETLDNPGWVFTFDLRDTPLAGATLAKVDIQRSERDWFWCQTVGETFKAACGPRNLEDVLMSFREWVTRNGVSISTDFVR